MTNNRQIKFRIWNRKRNKIIFPYPNEGLRIFTANGFINLIHCFENSCIKDENNYYENYKDDDIVIQQFIGLLDKNGREIYEGDILEYIIDSDYVNTGRYICVIEWDHAGFRAKDRSNFGEMFVSDKMRFYPSIEDGEIIGNIFENSELLKYEN